MLKWPGDIALRYTLSCISWIVIDEATGSCGPLMSQRRRYEWRAETGARVTQVILTFIATKKANHHRVCPKALLENDTQRLLLQDSPEAWYSFALLMVLADVITGGLPIAPYPFHKVNSSTCASQTSSIR